MANHELPTLDSTYTDYTAEFKGRLEDQAKGFDPANTTATNITTGTIRWNSAEKKFQKWSGTAWGDLTDNYVLSGVTFSTGTANGVAYLNGSKVLTTGSALTFDGTNLSSTGGATFQGSPTGYSGGEVRLGSTTSDIQSSVSTQATGSPILFFDHRGTSNTGLFVWRNGSGAASELMRLTNTGLGIGTNSPNYSLTSYKAGANVNYIQVANGSTGAGSANGLLIGLDASGNGVINAQGAVNLNIAVAGAQRATIDSSGNLGLGVTPSAWGSNYRAVQIFGSSISRNDALDARLNIGNNVYFDSSNQPRYSANAGATYYRQGFIVPDHAWFTAPSGTAGTTISFTQAMTLNASGNLLVGNTNGTSRITASGVIESTTGGFKFPDGTTQTSAATAPTTANVLAATAGATVGAVGTYAMLRNYGVQGHIEPGQVVAGANLSYASATGTEARPVPSGSNWLCMGHAMGTQVAVSLGDRTTLFLRVS